MDGAGAGHANRVGCVDAYCHAGYTRARDDEAGEGEGERMRACATSERIRLARLPALACVVIVAGLLLVACRTSVAAPNPPAGVYKSTQLHFSVSYPTGWQAVPTSADQSSPAVPLTLVITRSGDTAASGSVSSFTLTVFDLRVGAV